MVKVKNKRNNSSKPQSKKKEGKTKLNPFEVHINKEKLKVLNRKQKHVKGAPGVSRSKAISKRKNTLLQEYKVHNKSNKFTDMRIGERDPNMPEEHRILARYTAEKVKAHKKNSIFNLADDEVLTHKGQLLTEIEKFENEASDDDDEDANNLEADFVKEAHFGGGLFHKVSSDGAMSHKDLINQLILESKKRKNERLKIKEQTLELTEKLDTEWKDLLPLVNSSRKTAQTNAAAPEKPKNDDYDKVMRELKFEARGNPSDRLKSEEEILKKEIAELKHFEKERVKRMQGADDLEDNFMIEDINEEETPEGDGNSTDEHSELEEDEENIKKKQKTSKKQQKLTKKDNKETLSDNDVDEEVIETDDKGSEEEEEEESGEDDDDMKPEDNSEVDAEELAETNENDSNVADDSDEDDNLSLSDLKADASESSASEDEVELENVDVIEKPSDVAVQEENTGTEQENGKTTIQITLPDCYSALEEKFEYARPEKLGTLLSKMIQMIAGNKEKSETLFSYILQYIDSSYCTFKKLAYLLPHLFDLAKANPQKTSAAIREFLKEKHHCYRSKPKKYPPFSVLLVLKMISAFYTTSDFRHCVVTPAFVFISQMLTYCRVKTRRDVSYGLFLVTLIAEYTALSKRVSPAAVNFLTGLIHMAIPKTSVRLIKIPPPFKYTCTLLVLQQSMRDFTGELVLQESDLRRETAANAVFHVSALSLAVKLLSEMVENCSALPSSCEMFQRTLQFLQRLPLDRYPSGIQEEVRALIECLESNRADRKLDYITAPQKKPKLLRLYEPNIEKVYDGKRHKGKSREKMERDKLLHKIKKETKGAVREIRRDKSFLGRVQINQRLQNDAERKEKVKRIYADAANQQAELNSMDRKRKKR